MRIFHFVAAIFVSYGAIVGTGIQAAQGADYPVRPLKLVVPFAPGGPIDIMARPVAQKLGALLGQPVTVENRAGASGNIGTEFVTRAPADGYTLLIAGGSQAINASVYKKLNFDFSRDLKGVAMLGTGSSVMLVPGSSSIRTPQQFIDYIRAKPQGGNFASAGVGTSTHVIGEMFKQATGLNMTHISFKGSAPAAAETIAGRIDMMFDSAISVVPLVKSGQLRAIALGGDERLESLPGVPTLKELGINVVLNSWTGIFVPSGTQQAMVERLNAEINRILAMPDIRSAFEGWGNKPAPMAASAFDAFSKSEVSRFAKVVEGAGISAD